MRVRCLFLALVMLCATACTQSSSEGLTPLPAGAPSPTVRGPGGEATHVTRTPLPNQSPLIVTFLNVGQGDCEWIKTPDGQDILIDAGKEVAGPIVLTYLQSHGVKDLEVVVLTHPDDDHVGGLVRVLQDLPVKEVVYSGQPSSGDLYDKFTQAISAKAIPTVVARAGQTFAWGPVSATVLNPADPLDAGSNRDNDNSVTLRVSYGQVDVMLPGDISTAAERQVLQRQLPTEAEILKVSHHGSASSSGKAFLAAVQPKVAVIEVNHEQYKKHPNAGTLARLLAVTPAVYRTDLVGTVVVSTNGVTWTVTTEAALPGELAITSVQSCPGDANADGVVNLLDLTLVSAAYDPGAPAANGLADLNGDDVVDVLDLTLVTSNYGRACR